MSDGYRAATQDSAAEPSRPTTVAADGVVTIVTVDPDTRRAVPLPEELAELFRAPD